MAKEYVPYTGPVVTRAEAKAAGLKRYFSGRACKHGHLYERQTVNGTCLICSEKMSSAAAAKKPAERAASKRAWYEANIEKHRADTRAWRARNREKWREWTRGWLLKHAEKLRALRAERSAIHTARGRRWRKANPEKFAAQGRNGRMRRRNAEGHHTAAEVLALFEKQRGRCGYCRKSIRAGYHADHIQPIARGGSNWISNIQLLCPKCNTRKNVSDPVDFARRVGLLI